MFEVNELDIKLDMIHCTGCHFIDWFPIKRWNNLIFIFSIDFIIDYI